MNTKQLWAGILFVFSFWTGVALSYSNIVPRWAQLILVCATGASIGYLSSRHMTLK